ncbi:hypothetical protein Emag_006707 [Eimeria magna]
MAAPNPLCEEVSCSGAPGPRGALSEQTVESFLAEVTELLLRPPQGAAAAAAAAKGVWDYDIEGILSSFLRLTEEGLLEMEHAGEGDALSLEAGGAPASFPGSSPRSTRRVGGPHTMRFTQAALLVEKSAAVWGLRIERLHALAFDLMQQAQLQEQEGEDGRGPRARGQGGGPPGGGPPMSLQQLRKRALQQLGQATCLLMPEQPPPLRKEGASGAQGPRAPDIVRLPAVLRGPSAAAAAAAAAASVQPERQGREIQGGGSGAPEGAPVAASWEDHPDDRAMKAYDELRGLREEVAAPDSWEECPDLFETGDALGAPEGPLERLPEEESSGAPLPGGPLGPPEAQQKQGSVPPPVQRAARPDAWVHELLRESAGGPPALDKKRAREILGNPEEGGPPNASGAPSPQYLAFLNFLYEDVLNPGAPGACEARGGREALSLSALVHFELLQLRQRRRGGPPARSPSGGSTAAALQELLRVSTAEDGGALLGAPSSRPLREALMSLPTCCSDPREDQGPSRGPPCRPPPAGILGALQNAGTHLNAPGGPLLLHRASTREGQQSFVRGLWGPLPSGLEGGGASTTEGEPPGKLAGRSTAGNQGGAPGLLPGYPQIRVPPAPHLRLLTRQFCPPKDPQHQRQQQQQQRLQWLRRRQARSLLPRARSKEAQAAAATAAAAAAAAAAEAAAAEEALHLLEADPQDDTFAYDFVSLSDGTSQAPAAAVVAAAVAAALAAGDAADPAASVASLLRLEDEEARACGGLRLSAEETAAIEEEIHKAQGLRLLVSKQSLTAAAEAAAAAASNKLALLQLACLEFRWSSLRA